MVTKYLGSDTEVSLTAYRQKETTSYWDDRAHSFITESKTIKVVERIGANAFSGSNVVEVKLWNYFGENGDGILYDNQFSWGSWKSIGNYAFRDCKDLRRVTIPASVKEFGVGIFEGCDKRQLTVTVEIGSAAEQYCKDIGVNIEYATVSGIGANGRITYRPLSRETVALVSYSVNTNALFTTSRARPDTALSLFSSVDYYTVVRLCEGALTDMGYYEQLILPDTLTEIEDRAIVNWPTLKEITIPAGVKKIGRHAFDAVGSDQLVFRVVRGSYAEKYCRDKGFGINYDP